MAYTPTLNDINQNMSNGNYKPSLSDITEHENKNKGREIFNEMTFLKNPILNYENLGSVLQGMAKGGQNIARLLPGSPDYNLEGVFGNEKTNPELEKFGQYLPLLPASLLGIPGIIGSGLYGASQALPGERLKEGIYSGLGALGGNLLGNLSKGTGAVINQLRGKLSPTSIAKIAQNSHDLMKKNVEKIFSGVSKSASERGITTIPIDKKIIQDSEEFLPKTRANKSLLNKAETGDYDSLRKLQSDLGSKGFSRKSSSLASERDVGEEMLDTRDKINESISNHFKNTNNHDLANELDKARKLYSEFKDIYYSRPSISKMVNEKLRLVPKNTANILNENSIPMEKFRQSHPEIRNALSQLKTLKNIKKLGIGTGITSGIGGLLYGNNLFNKPSYKEGSD